MLLRRADKGNGLDLINAKKVGEEVCARVGAWICQRNYAKKQTTHDRMDVRQKFPVREKVKSKEAKILTIKTKGGGGAILTTVGGRIT